MTGNDIAKKSGGLTTFLVVLMAIIFHYVSVTAALIIGFSLALIAAGLMWRNYHYFFSNR